MTRDDHERERRAFWDACCAATAMLTDQESPFTSAGHEAQWCAELATAKLAERDKMFPGPVESVTCPLCGESVLACDVVDQCFTKCQKCGAELLVRAVSFDAVAIGTREDGEQ